MGDESKAADIDLTTLVQDMYYGIAIPLEFKPHGIKGDAAYNVKIKIDLSEKAKANPASITRSSYDLSKEWIDALEAKVKEYDTPQYKKSYATVIMNFKTIKEYIKKAQKKIEWENSGGVKAVLARYLL